MTPIPPSAHVLAYISDQFYELADHYRYADMVGASSSELRLWAEGVAELEEARDLCELAAKGCLSPWTVYQVADHAASIIGTLFDVTDIDRHASRLLWLEDEASIMAEEGVAA